MGKKEKMICALLLLASGTFSSNAGWKLVSQGDQSVLYQQEKPPIKQNVLYGTLYKSWFMQIDYSESNEDSTIIDTSATSTILVVADCKDMKIGFERGKKETPEGNQEELEFQKTILGTPYLSAPFPNTFGEAMLENICNKVLRARRKK